MRGIKGHLLREAALKLSATGGGETLERGPRSLVALLQCAYLTTDQVTQKMRVGERPNPVKLPTRFLRPMPVARLRTWRRTGS